jgi:hypothetical protein
MRSGTLSRIRAVPRRCRRRFGLSGPAHCAGIETRELDSVPVCIAEPRMTLVK